jgi:hypothetical protein
MTVGAYSYLINSKFHAPGSPDEARRIRDDDGIGRQHRAAPSKARLGGSAVREAASVGGYIC